MCGPSGMSWTSLGPFQKLGVQCSRKRPTQPPQVTSERRSQVGRGSSWKGCQLRGFRTSREAKRFGPRPRGRFPGWAGTSRSVALPRGGKSVPRGRLAGRAGGRTVTARPSLASPPPGFLRRQWPPCCCGGKAAPAEPSGRDRLRNRFAAADLTTDPAAAAAAPQGLPRRGCRGARGESVARWRARGARWVKPPGSAAAAGRGAGADAAGPGAARAAPRGPRAADRRGPFSSGRAAPALGPGRARQSRAETWAAGSCPHRGVGGTLLSEAGTPGAPQHGLAWQVTTAASCWGATRSPAFLRGTGLRVALETHFILAWFIIYLFIYCIPPLLPLLGQLWCRVSGEPHPGASK